MDCTNITCSCTVSPSCLSTNKCLHSALSVSMPPPPLIPTTISHREREAGRVCGHGSLALMKCGHLPMWAAEQKCELWLKLMETQLLTGTIQSLDIFMSSWMSISSEILPIMYVFSSSYYVFLPSILALSRLVFSTEVFIRSPRLRLLSAIGCYSKTYNLLSNSSIWSTLSSEVTADSICRCSWHHLISVHSQRFALCQLSWWSRNLYISIVIELPPECHRVADIRKLPKARLRTSLECIIFEKQSPNLFHTVCCMFLQIGNCSPAGKALDSSMAVDAQEGRPPSSFLNLPYKSH